MKAITYAILLSMVVGGVYAQEDKLKPIQAPSSPSSVIIGSQPSTISRPKSWQAVEASIFENYVDNSGSFVVPNDFSIEVSPYWLKKDLKIPIEEFVGPNVGESIKQTFSLSVSSTNNYIINDSINTDALGFGFRTMLYQGSKERLLALRMAMSRSDLALYLTVSAENTQITSKETFLKTFLGTIEREMSKRLGAEDAKKWMLDFKSKLDSGLPTITDSTSEEQIISFRDKAQEIIDDFSNVDESINALQELQKDPKGFKLEIAGALSLNFPTQSFEYSIIPRLGFWITPAYEPIKGKFEFLGVLRYLWYNDDFYNKYHTDENFFNHSFDYGCRLVYKPSKFSAEVEVVGRSSKVILEKSSDANGVQTIKSKTDSALQYLFNFNYRISENLILSYTIGQKFGPTADAENNNLVSVVTLNFGMGGPTVFDLSK